MQTIVDQIMISQGVDQNFVQVTPTNKRTVAYCVGITKNDVDFPLLGLKGKVSLGIIVVNEAKLRRFKDDEIAFILAHECAHIVRSHLWTTAMWVIVENIIRGEKNENAMLVNLIKTAFMIFAKDHLPPNAVALRDQEYEADELGVRITNNQQSAISCLTKLVRGNMNAPSHVWELFGENMPAMTMGERIAELRKRTNAFFNVPNGNKFFGN
jgi:Zn-dependent protease with chaperone function